MAITFRGFYTPSQGKTQVLYDQDLIKQELLNHFNTKKGERVMNSDYGFIGWDLIFENQNPANAKALEDDARRIIQMDPRVQEQSITVTAIDYGYQVSVLLYFVVLDTVDELLMVFQNRQTALGNSTLE